MTEAKLLVKNLEGDGGADNDNSKGEWKVTQQYVFILSYRVVVEPVVAPCQKCCLSFQAYCWADYVAYDDFTSTLPPLRNLKKYVLFS